MKKLFFILPLMLVGSFGWTQANFSVQGERIDSIELSAVLDALNDEIDGESFSEAADWDELVSDADVPLEKKKKIHRNIEDCLKKKDYKALAKYIGDSEYKEMIVYTQILGFMLGKNRMTKDELNKIVEELEKLIDMRTGRGKLARSQVYNLIQNYSKLVK